MLEEEKRTMAAKGKLAAITCYFSFLFFLSCCHFLHKRMIIKALRMKGNMTA